MTTSFAIRLSVETPVALRGLCHLDAILGAVVTGRGLPLDDIPLARHQGVWQGSAAILECGPFGMNASEQMRLKHVVASAIPDAVAAHLPRGQRRIGEMSPYRNQLTRRPVYEGVRAAWFTGLGDADAVADLLADVRYVGAMGATGYGRITGMSAFPLAPSPASGMVAPSGMPLRAVPLKAWDALGLERPEVAPVSMQAWQPPYWSGDEDLCILPRQSDLIATHSEVCRMVGAL